MDSVYFARYYIGCQCRYTWPDGFWAEGELLTVGDTGFLYIDFKLDSDGKTKELYYDVDDDTHGTLYLYLRDKEEMTLEEGDEYYKLCKKVVKEELRITVDTPWSLDFLFRHGIDAFGILDNQPTLPQQPKTRHEKKERFLQVYGKTHSYIKSYIAAGVSNVTPRNWMKQDPVFKEAYDLLRKLQFDIP